MLCLPTVPDPQSSIIVQDDPVTDLATGNGATDRAEVHIATETGQSGAVHAVRTIGLKWEVTPRRLAVAHDMTTVLTHHTIAPAVAGVFLGALAAIVTHISLL
jgi:hypothetical protein